MIIRLAIIEIERLDVHRIERPEKPDAMAKLPTFQVIKRFLT